MRFLHLLDVLGVAQFRDSISAWNKKIFPSPKCPSRLSVQPASCSVSPGVKRHKSQAEYTSSSNAEMKSGWSYTSTSPTCLHYLWSCGSNFASDVEDQNITVPQKPSLRELSVCRLAFSRRKTQVTWAHYHMTVTARHLQLTVLGSHCCDVHFSWWLMCTSW